MDLDSQSLLVHSLLSFLSIIINHYKIKIIFGCKSKVVAYGMGTADAGKNIAEGVNNYKVRIESLVGKNHVGNDW